MLKELQIKNFKGWKDTGKIRMAPITLFFGANSSGKSSIGQFLMMLKQTVDSSDRKTAVNVGNSNSAVQLGSYRDMVYEHNESNHIDFNYMWTLPEKISFRDSVTNTSYDADTFSFSSQIGLAEEKAGKLEVDFMEYLLFNEEKRTLSIKMAQAEKSSNYNVSAKQYKLKRNTGRAWPAGAPAKFYGFPEEAVAYYQNADFVQSLNFEHEKLFRSLYYLGPLRRKADRIYSWSGDEPESVGYIGEYTVAAFLSAQHRTFNFRPKEHTRTLEELIAMKLVEMGLVEMFEVKPISPSRREYEVKVRTRGSSVLVDLIDVGFGVSQVLPVLVQCFYAPENSIILMEQPEIHLHPNAQAVLADVMIDVITSRSESRNRNIQLIIETHSEHFLRRLQRRIAEEERIDKNSVAAYFANTTNSPTTLDLLEIDEFGNICNWPENFFGDEMGDLLEQSKAALKKRQSSQNNAGGQRIEP